MKITSKLCNNFMDCLAAIAISANGGIPLDKEGNPNLSEKERNLVEDYARNTFCSILHAWETDNEKWEIEESCGNELVNVR